MSLKIFLFITFSVIVLADSVKKRRRSDEGRQARLFSFNTIDNDISEFPTININPASLALGGAVVLGAGILLPFFLKNYAHENNDRYSRFLDNAEFGAEAVFEFAQRIVSDSQGFQGCPLRIACWTVQRDLADSRVILNQIVSNRLLSAMVNSSAVEDAMASGRHGRDCSTYGPCPVQEHHLPILMHQLSILSDQGFH